MGGSSELEWTILRSWHDPDNFQTWGAELDLGDTQGNGLTRWSLVCPVSLEQCPSSGVQQTTVEWVVLGGWHGAWGEPKRKKCQLEVGSPRLEDFSVLPSPYH